MSKKVKTLLFLFWMIRFDCRSSRRSKIDILPFHIYITVMLWWTSHPSDLLVFILYILHNRLHTTEGEWLSRLTEGLGWGWGGVGGRWVPFWYAALCASCDIEWFSVQQSCLYCRCEREDEAERHAWRGICSWRVLCHWRSLHRLSAQHPPSLSSAGCQCSISTLGQLIDGVSVCALVY